MPKINTQKILGIKIQNCPVCNRQPKVIVDVEAFDHGVKEHVTIKCHRFFHRRHLKVYGRGNSHTEAIINGIQKWNYFATQSQYTPADKNLHMRKEILT